MLSLNCNHCGRRFWYDSHEWGVGDMVSPEIDMRYYSDEKGEREIEACPGCGTLISREEWEDRPANENDYGVVRLILLWVLKWGVIEDGKIVRSAPGMPLARWSNDRECWRVLSAASDLEDASDFAPTQSFTDAWLIIELVQSQAKTDDDVARRYRRFIELIDEVWGTAVLSLNLAEGFKPWHVVWAMLDAFEV